jgi:broad-specificity NMP kinase
VFAVALTGPPGAGKTACLTALTDALVEDEIAHASLDMDEVAWAYPFPSIEERAALLGNAWEGHRRMGHEVLLFCEVVESNAHLSQLLESIGAEDHLLVRLEARPATMQERIVAREPPGWSGLAYLLGEVERDAISLTELDGVHLTLDSEQLSPEEEAARIRAERPDKLAG